MVGIIDYGMGNIGSIENMLKRIKVKSTITSNIDILNNCDKLVLPGVGSFDHGMKKLEEKGLINFLHKSVIESGKPILGICLGMHLFAKKSEEGLLKGIGWIDGNVKRFSFNNRNIKVPHMGWNTIKYNNNSLFKNLPSEKRFYFVHSYYFQCNNQEDIIAKTDYGFEFTSAINKMNIWGTQFHPEKSHLCGTKVFQNFANI